MKLREASKLIDKVLVINSFKLTSCNNSASIVNNPYVSLLYNIFGGQGIGKDGSVLWHWFVWEQSGLRSAP